jgi:cytochrome o ubiquinol oxidase subunit III
MSQVITSAKYPLESGDVNDDKSVFGFWVYLMTDCVLFASLFATFVVLRNATYGGPSGEDIFSLPFVLSETLILLTSSFTAGMGIVAARQKDKAKTIAFFSITFLLGLAFLALELNEFHHLYVEGNSWHASAFLTSFFTLVGTHGLHITIGLVWMGFMLIQISRKGLGYKNLKRLTMLSLFWHFLDIIWIFIFTIVYLMGVAD